MKEYFRYFRWLYIALAIMLVVFGIIKGTKAAASKASYYERTNKECTTTQRVFDYADVLSDKEEEKLAKLIDKREKQTCCDIILITYNKSLEEYAKAIEPSVRASEYVRVYAEQFYEEHNFGYNKPNGDGVILVDNWFRENDGKIYTWFCTTGIVQDRYSDADIDHILDRVYRYVETNPYKAYKTYINEFYSDMSGGRVYLDIPGYIPLLAGLVAAIIFIAANWKSKSGKKTTTAVTYVEGKRANFVNRQDIFIRKSVTQRRIESSSSGSHSGGGHSGGHSGGSHGGGGHSR